MVTIGRKMGHSRTSNAYHDVPGAKASLDNRRRWVSEPHESCRHRFAIDGPPNPFLRRRWKGAMLPEAAEPAQPAAA